MNELKEKLIMLLYECNQHKKMINNAYQHLESFLPLAKEKYVGFSLEQIGFIDQFLFRFSKLQDTMGEKLFSTMLFLLGEDFSKKPFIDMLNRLERLELLDKQEWMNLRIIRNNVAHEYSYNVNELVDSLNDIFLIKDKLLSIYDTVYNYCKEKFDFVKNSTVLE
ncbi:MAG TPA: hypothetical protein PK897_04865 [Treponema sp.]|nr:hypothetical protein [Treponema sp.]HRS03673.1 hypothetical protein [Treponema sp.]HRU28336.1 hypothetical protein [Treponema sp.]